MADVFISYARANEAVAERVAKALKAAGFDAWRDDQLPAHRAYSEVIEQRLHDAKAVVVLWSEDAAKSQWVRAEADYARTEGKLVQAQLDEALPPMPFNQIQCADLRGWRGKAKHRGWTKLAESVASVVAGEQSQAAGPSAASAARRIDRRTVLAALAFLLVFVGALAFLAPRVLGPDSGPPKVAVLPFESIGGSDEALVAGIWEDTRQALSRNPQLLVLGPNTSEEIATKGSAVARKAADYLVEASVRTAADRVRVSTNLVRSRDGTQVWSQTFDRKLDDVFALQGEIAQEIEGRIRGRLAREGGRLPEHITTSGEVYALYSDARAKIRNRQVPKYEEALKQLEQVVEMDPNFAPGWATLSVAAAFNYSGEPPADAGSPSEGGLQAEEAQAQPRFDDRPQAYARRAIALAPNLAAGHAALGFALSGRGPVAKGALQRAVQLDPTDVEALNWLASSLDSEREVAERMRLYSRIVEIEPLWWPALLNKLWIQLESKDYAAAEKERQRLKSLGATALAGMVGVAIGNAKGDLSAAARAGIDAYNASGADDRPMLGYELAFVLLKLGYFDEVAASFEVPPPAPYLWRNDPRGLEMIEALNLAPERFFNFGPLTPAASRVYVATGRGEKLAEMYHAAAGSPEKFSEVAGEGGLASLAPLVAIALRQSGDDAQATALLSSAEARLSEQLKKPGWPERWVLLARVRAVQGHKEEALRLLAEGIRRGWLPDMPMHRIDIGGDPALAMLKGDPRFEAHRRALIDYIRKEQDELGPFHLGGRKSGEPAWRNVGRT